MDNKEKHTLSLIKNKVKVIFDIGAREDGIEFIEIMPNAEFHFFEPNEIFAKSLESKIPVGVKAVVNQYGMFDSIIDNAVYYENTQSFIPHPFGLSSDSGHKFNLKTIDWYINQNKIKTIDFLKIDAEGCDYKILQGAKQIIDSNNIRYLQFEYWDGVRKFYDLLNEKYDMYFINEDLSLSYLNEEIIHMIDNGRIPSGQGGDIFCAHKTESFKP
jgi:FkbM family methyltransferase